jgi:hypothetical protein
MSNGPLLVQHNFKTVNDFTKREPYGFLDVQSNAFANLLKHIDYFWSLVETYWLLKNCALVLRNVKLPLNFDLSIYGCVLVGSAPSGYVDFKFISLPLAIVRIDCTIVRVIEPQRLLVVLHNGILKGTYLT